MRGAAKEDKFTDRYVIISIHAPHAGSGSDRRSQGGDSQISIHAPHAGSGRARTFHGKRLLLFQSTLPMRGAAKNLIGW